MTPELDDDTLQLLENLKNRQKECVTHAKRTVNLDPDLVPPEFHLQPTPQEDLHDDSILEELEQWDDTEFNAG